MIHILNREFKNFLDSLMAYVIIGVFLTAVGLIVWIFPETSVLEYGYTDLDALFSLSPYVMIFLIPAITMRSFAEEKKMGTMELLLTKPISDWEIILGKYFAAFAIVLFSLSPTLLYYFSVYLLGDPIGNIDTPGVVGSFIGLTLLGAVFCSIGILASASTSNQIISFIVAAFICFLLYTGFESLAALWSGGRGVIMIKQLGIIYHYESMSRGLVDSRDLIYFLSVIGMMLLGTKVIISSRKW